MSSAASAQAQGSEPLRLGVTTVPVSVAEAKAVAQAAEAAGFWGFGLGDSQAKFAELAVSLTASLLATERLTIGSTVTNPSTRHWTVLAAMSRSLLEIAPDRFFLGLSSGNSAVRAADGSPATSTDLRAAIPAIRAACPGALPILVAADGRRMAAVAGAVADGLIVGTGVDADAFATVTAAADDSRSTTGNTTPLEHWLYLHLNVVADERELDRARAASVGMAVTFAHRAFARTLVGKNVPERYQPVIEERMERYDMAGHAQTGAAGRGNSAMFSDLPELEEYLLRRFCIYGTETMCRDQLERAVRMTGARSVWMSTIVADPVTNLQRAGAAFRSLIQH